MRPDEPVFFDSNVDTPKGKLSVRMLLVRACADWGSASKRTASHPDNQSDYGPEHQNTGRFGNGSTNASERKIKTGTKLV